MAAARVSWWAAYFVLDDGYWSPIEQSIAAHPLWPAMAVARARRKIAELDATTYRLKILDHDRGFLWAGQPTMLLALPALLGKPNPDLKLRLIDWRNG